MASSFNGLNSFVSFLEERGELLRIKEPVNPVLEIAEMTDRQCKCPGGGKALLFENTGTRYPVLTNMLGSQSRILAALRMESFDEVGERTASFTGGLLSTHKGSIEKIRLLSSLSDLFSLSSKKYRGQPPCQESVRYNADLGELPFLKSWPLEGGRFITLPVVHSRGPLDGRPYMGMCRMQVLSKDTAGMHWRRCDVLNRRLEESTHRLPLAVCLGGDPVYAYAAAAPLPDWIDRYWLAGLLRGKPVEMAQCFTQDLMVPADCDFVLEGYIQKSEGRVNMGPAGECTGLYSSYSDCPVFHVTCITHRRDAICPATVSGMPPMEDKWVRMASEKIFIEPLKLFFIPEAVDLHLPEEGAGCHFAVISIDKRYEGQPFKVAAALWGIEVLNRCKFVVVVDKDVNVRDFDAVSAAIAANYDPAEDTLTSRGPADEYDCLAQERRLSGRMCIDATSKGRSCTGRTVDDVLTVLLNHEDADCDIHRKLWLAGVCCDAVDDSSIVGGRLVIDARGKMNRLSPLQVRQ